MSEPVRGVVVAHADLAEALVRVVESISGVTGALRAVSNRGLGPDTLREVIEGECSTGETVVFADLGGGSCGVAGLGLASTAERVACVTGVNVPMLLDFVFHRELPLEELVARLVEKGRTEQKAQLDAPTKSA